MKLGEFNDEYTSLVIVCALLLINCVGLHGRRSVGGQGDMPPYFLKCFVPPTFWE